MDFDYQHVRPMSSIYVEKGAQRIHVPKKQRAAPKSENGDEQERGGGGARSAAGLVGGPRAVPGRHERQARAAQPAERAYVSENASVCGPNMTGPCCLLVFYVNSRVCPVVSLRVLENWSSVIALTKATSAASANSKTQSELVKTSL